MNSIKGHLMFQLTIKEELLKNSDHGMYWHYLTGSIDTIKETIAIIELIEKMDNKDHQ